MATTPGHGVGGHFKVGAGSEGLEDSVAVHTDAGADSEQRRGVDGHPEPVAPIGMTERHPGSLAHRAPGFGRRPDH
jgi:hypothetical protein